MAMYPPPHNMANQYQPKKNKKRAKSYYCVLCRELPLKISMHDHMNSLPHHRELDSLLGSVPCHDCQACQVSSMDFEQYAQHIATPQHETNLKCLMSSNVKPISLDKTLTQETMKRLLERNRMITKENKKVLKKRHLKKKKLAAQKQAGRNQAPQTQAAQTQAAQTQAAQTQAAQTQAAQTQAAQTQAAQKLAAQKLAAQKLAAQKLAAQKLAAQKLAAQKQAAQQQGASGQQQVMHQNIGPNKSKQQVLGAQQKGNHTAVVQNKVSKQLADQHLANKSSNSQHSSQTCGAAQNYKWFPMNHFSNYKYQSDELAVFTSDQLPTTGSVIFNQKESCAASEPKQSATASNSQPKPGHIQDADVTTMLREIRRALGVREPCRADREARKQNAEVEAQLSELCSSLATLEKDATAQGSNQTAGKTSTQHTAEQNAPGASASIPSKTKVRIAHKAAAVQKSGEDCLRKVMSNLTPKAPAVTGPRSKPTWKQMFNESKRKEGMARFGIQLANSPHNKSTFDMGVDEDLMLSEGFHWESLSNPNMPLPPSLPAPPPSCLTSTPRRPRRSRGKTSSTTGVPDEGVLLIQDKCCGPKAVATSVKKESECENSGGFKRKHLQDNGVIDVEAVVKRRKFKLNNDQDPMDKLLAVSLQEEELSQSLQDVDKSLVLARNALQAAYTEVQRLMLLRQQCTAEVDSLRAKRIEILQSMQEVYSGSSNMEPVATTSAAASPDVILPRSPSPRSSPPVLAPPPNTHQTSALTPSISQTHPALPDTKSTITMIKREAVMPPVSRQPSPQIRTSPPPSLPTAASPAVALNEKYSTEDPNPLNPANSLCTQQEQVKLVAIKEQIESFPKEVLIAKDEKIEEPLSTEPVEGNDVKPLLKEDKSPPAIKVIDEKGDENADLVEVMEPKRVVINIDGSEDEDSPGVSSKAPGPQEVPPESRSVECDTSSTQTSQPIPFKMKSASPVVLESEATPPPAVVGEEEMEPALGPFLNHTAAVHSMQVHEDVLYTCSADNTARAYSLANREYLGVFEGHTNKINCLLVASSPNMPARLYTGSSDQTVRIYSTKSKKCLETITLDDRVLCLHMAWYTVFIGLASGSVATYDLKTSKPLDVFECHSPRGVSCLATSQEGARRLLLVGSYDSTISVRDAKSGLLLRSLEGHSKTVLCMKVVNNLVYSGSSDTSVHTHNIHTGELTRVYKGHGHAVTSIVILGKVMVTSCLDKLIRVFELQTHDRLQVYGGHSDMVMCMAVRQSVIYTGCYDGSVQAVKLNLMKNYRCWWQNCCLIFGIAEHLVQHLIRDHTNPNLEVVNCRWRRCSALFPTQQAVKEEFPGHMQSHVDVDSKVKP